MMVRGPIRGRRPATTGVPWTAIALACATLALPATIHAQTPTAAPVGSASPAEPQPPNGEAKGSGTGASVRLTLISKPPGAVVTIDDKRIPGTTPIAETLVRPGRRRVEFRLDDYESQVITRRWTPNTAGNLAVSLRPVPVRLSLVSTPPGAAVWVNGRRLLASTPVDNIRVAPGPSTIELYLHGYAPATVERRWGPNAKAHLSVTLEPPHARVTFTTVPPGATIIVNDHSLSGVTPLADVSLPPGHASIQVRLEGYEPVRLESDWIGGETNHVEAILEPLPALISFVTSPAGAEALVDSTRLSGVTPIGATPVTPGRHRIELRLDGHDSYVLDRLWLPGSTEKVEAVLRARTGRLRVESEQVWDRITIDHKAVTLRPGEWMALPPGFHELQTYAGNENGSAAFEIVRGQDSTVQVDWTHFAPDPDRYVLLPAATVTLGSENYLEENPPHTVEMKPFWIGRTEVTVVDYRACVEADRCAPPATGKDCSWGRPNREKHPVNCVAATDAESYALWLAGRDGLPYRLPTAAEWERAARGVGGRKYPWGDEAPSGQCNSCDRSCRFQHFRNGNVDDGWAETAPVKSVSDCRTPEGVFDLVGNVAEWCRKDARGQYEIRGGSWSQIGAFLDPAFPTGRDASQGHATVGFRLVIPAGSDR